MEFITGNIFVLFIHLFLPLTDPKGKNYHVNVLFQNNNTDEIVCIHHPSSFVFTFNPFSTGPFKNLKDLGEIMLPLSIFGVIWVGQTKCCKIVVQN